MSSKNHDDSVNTGTSSSSGDGATDVILDDGENSFSFYEIWNHEILVLKSAIDERIQSITERSQKEIERIAATVTGISAPAPYKIKTVGPKIPPRQWTAHRAMMKQQYQEQQQEQQRLQNSKTSSSSFSPFNSIEPRSISSMDGKVKNKSATHRDLRLSPSGRSQTTATSDKTIPQSNLSSRPKQPNTVRNVLSIPEETSLQPTTEEENENDMMNEDDDENSESGRSSSPSEISSFHIIPTQVIPPVVDKQSHIPVQTQTDVGVEDQLVPNNDEKSETLFDEEAKKNSGSIDETARDIPSMIASMSLSSASRSEAGSPAATKAPVTAPTFPKQSFRYFDIPNERQSRQIVDGKRQKNAYPWLLERVQPQHGQQRDAPTATSSKQHRPDAPARSIVRKQLSKQLSIHGNSKDVMETIATSSVLTQQTNHDIESLPMAPENVTVVNDSVSTTQKGTDNPDSGRQQLLEALTSKPSIEETLPSLTDKEISAICRTETETKILDNDDMTHVSGKKSSQQRKHRKPPSPETFMMSGHRKVKRKKVSKSPTKGDNKTSNDTGTQLALLDSLEESTIDTFSKIEDKETATEAPSTDIVNYNNERRIQPHEGAIEPSLVRLEYVTEKKIKDPYNDEGLYTGILILGKPETHGTMKYKDGRYYTGSWKRGRWNGHGKAIFANGDTYTGDYVHDQRHGVGRYEWSDARVYDGRFNNDQREGHGTYSWPNGSVYCGEFHLGLRHGNGTYTYDDGSVYCGEWRNGKQHGNGECIWADGRCFRGEWLHGHTHSGVEFRADGSIRHDGVWHKNRPVRPKDHSKKQDRVHDQSHEIRLRASFEIDQSSKPSLKCLRQGKSLVRNVSDTSCTMDESTNSKLGVTGIVSASMSE